MSDDAHRPRIEAAFADRTKLADPETIAAVEATIAALDAGALRVATHDAASDAWTTHAWLMQAILLYFALRKVESLHAGPLEWHDKIPTKHDLAAAGVRVVPPGVARYGAHLERGVVLMP